MPDFVKAISLKELPPGASAQIHVQGRDIALFNVDGQIYAIDDHCSHAEAPLSDGVVHGCEIECPLHGARFDLKTGENLTPPALEPVDTFEIKIEGDDVYIHTDFS